MERIWNKENYEKYCSLVAKDLQLDCLYSEEFIPTVAKNILRLNPDLEKFIVEELGSLDPVEKLTEDI